MKIFGKEFKFNGFDIWHKGNFNPDNKANSVHTHDDRYYTESEINSKLNTKADIEKTNIKTLNSGWYRIAENIGNRALGRFVIKEERSSYHQTVEFIAGIHYVNNPIINVLGNSSFGNNGAFRYIRIVKKSTYDPVYLEIYIDGDGTNGIQAFLHDNIQNSGWQILDWTAGSVPSGYAEYKIDLDISRGFNTTEEINAAKGFKHNGQNLDDKYLGKTAKASDSYKLDGKNASDFAPSGYGLGSLCRTVTGDWNDHTLTGFYMGYDLTNQAPGGSWRYCIVMKHNDLWVSQTMMDFNGIGVYQRNKINGTWEAWRKLDISKTSELINDSNFTTATGHTHSTLDSNIKLGSGGSCEVTQDSGSWWQKLFFTDTSDKNIHRFGFSERQGSGDYIELFGVDGYGNIYGKGQKLSKEGHTHSKSNITDFPTKLSEFENDIGAGGGTNIVCSSTEPNLKAGEWWYKE